MPALEKTRGGLQWLVIALFLGALWLPALDSFFHLDHAPIPNENRAPAPFPAFNHSLDGVRDYIGGLEHYYDDHFGFRRRLIDWNNHWKRELFKESTLPNVITGRDGWLYYSGDNMIENTLRLTTFTTDELAQWKSLLEHRRDWLAQQGIAYLLVIPPNKESIYPEHLPAWMKKARPTTKLDDFLAYMKTNSTVNVLDLRPCLLRAKKSELVYQKTDTHWNFDGAFVAHQALINALPGLQALPDSAFKRTSGEKGGGDLARMLGQERAMPERDYATYTPVPPLQPLVENPLPDFKPGKKWTKVTAPIVTVNTNRTGAAIFFRDSFCGYWVPFMGQYFGRVLYISEEDWDPALIKKEKPAVVVDEIVEREFYTAKPREIRASTPLQ